MSGQQRLLDDVIDDPNALESFLGGLTSDSELLSSGETVDNVVASLARSLASDYEDSPLFDNIDNQTSNNLTDISQSYVPSDFENVTSNLGSESYFNAFTQQSDSNPPTTSTTDHQQLQQQQQHFNSSMSMSSSTTSAAATTTTQFAVSTGSNSICDSTSNINSSSTVSSNFTQQQNISLSDNGSSTSSSSSFSSILNNTSNFSTTQQQQQQQQQQQLNQQESSTSSNLVLSSTSTTSSLISNSPSLPSTISNTTGSSSTNTNSVVGVSLSDSSSIMQQQLNSSAQIQQVILQHQQQQQQQTDSSTIQINNSNISVNSSNLGINNNNLTTLLSNQPQNPSNITLSSIIPSNISSIRRTSLTLNEGDQQHGQQQQQFQIIQGQSTSNATGQPQLMQIQTVTGSSQQFIQQNPTFITSGGSGLTLVATGNGGSYTVVPTGTQFISANTLVQQQLKTTGGFFQQQTTGPIMTTTQNQGPQQILIRAKQPQILPKPILASTNSNIISTTPQKMSTSIVTSNQNNSIMSTTTTNNSGAVLQQFQQQQQQQQNTIVSSGEGVTLSTQQIGGAQQLAGTIVVNQFGQQILLPAQSMGQGGTYQLVLRQPQQAQQVLIQSPQSNQNIAGKQQQQQQQQFTTRFMSPIQNQTVQLQPIQTANGITYAIVGRYNPQQAQQTITTNSQQQQQLITTTESPMIQSTPPENNNLTTTNAFNNNNNNNNNTNSKSIQPQLKYQYNPPPQSNNQILNSSGEPPKKKPRPSKKKKPQAQVTIDLEDILKQSGIMDEDLQDDGLFNFGDEFSSTPAVEEQNYEQVVEQQQHTLNSYVNPNEKLNGLLSSSLPVKVLPPVEYKGKKKSTQNKKATPNKNNSFTPNRNTPTTPISTKKKKNSSANRTMYETNNNYNNNKTTPVSSKSNFNSKKKNLSKPTITSTSSSLDDSIALVAMGIGGKSPEPELYKYNKPEIKQEPKIINNQHQQQTVAVAKPSTPFTNASNTVPSPNTTPTGGASIQITSGGGRIIQTIQLAQKDQVLLRNIQVQITRLLQISSRNENEQVALQKLIHLQQQVIASGTPVPTNNSHVNFAQSVVGNNAFTIGGMPVDTSSDASGIGAQNKVKVNHQAIFAAVKQESGTTDKKLSSGVVQSTQSTQVSQQKSIEEKRIDEAVRRAEEEARKKWKKEEFDMILKRDQEAAQNPDYQIPFKSIESAIQRLCKYHIYEDRTDMNFEEFDSGFAETSKHLMDKFQSMSFKFRSLLLKESMKEVACSERVMLERVFVNEEKQKLEQDRLLVNQGEILDLPSPPPSWLPMINDMVDKEIKELEKNAINSHQVQSAIDSIMSFGNNNESSSITTTEEAEKVELDAFGVPTSSSGYCGDPDRNSIDEAIRSILG